MTAALERKIIRWIHIILSIPVVGYIYGPVSQIPIATMWVKFVFFPVIVVSGLWMWKGYAVKKWFKHLTT